MAKAILTFNEVIEINHILEDKGLRFKIHLRDACGSQSLHVEPLGNCACEGHYEDMRKEVIGYFNSKGIMIRFLENGLDFLTD